MVAPQAYWRHAPDRRVRHLRRRRSAAPARRPTRAERCRRGDRSRLFAGLTKHVGDRYSYDDPVYCRRGERRRAGVRASLCSGAVLRPPTPTGDGRPMRQPFTRERCFEGDLGHAGQSSAHRAARLGRLGVLDERRLVETGHSPDGDEGDLGDGRCPIDRSQRDRGIGVNRVGRLSARPGMREPSKRHCACGDQLLRVRARSVLEPRRYV